MNWHYCFGEDDPTGSSVSSIVCMCVRGVDHTVDEFDVPLEGER